LIHDLLSCHFPLHWIKLSHGDYGFILDYFSIRISYPYINLTSHPSWSFDPNTLSLPTTIKEDSFISTVFKDPGLSDFISAPDSHIMDESFAADSITKLDSILTRSSHFDPFNSIENPAFDYTLLSCASRLAFFAIKLKFNHIYKTQSVKALSILTSLGYRLISPYDIVKKSDQHSKFSHLVHTMDFVKSARFPDPSHPRRSPLRVRIYPSITSSHSADYFKQLFSLLQKRDNAASQLKRYTRLRDSFVLQTTTFEKKLNDFNADILDLSNK
jgi:hypothetical protein